MGLGRKKRGLPASAAPAENVAFNALTHVLNGHSVDIASMGPVHKAWPPSLRCPCITNPDKPHVLCAPSFEILSMHGRASSSLCTVLSVCETFKNKGVTASQHLYERI
eukprot:scaffold202220_cov21-Tisochrysis_lutea.AAC.1